MRLIELTCSIIFSCGQSLDYVPLQPRYRMDKALETQVVLENPLSPWRT